MTDPFFESQEVICQRFSKSLIDGRCVAMVGSGPVAQVYGTWSTMIDRLKEKTKFDAVGGDDLTSLAQKIKLHDEKAYCLTLKDIFGACEFYPLVYNTIVTAGFKTILTTNYDSALSVAAQSLVRQRSYNRYKYPSLPVHQIGNPSIFHIHGSIDLDEENMNIILSDDEFERGYGNDASTLTSFLQQIFAYFDTCFIGYSFTERPIRELFSKARKLSKSLVGDAADPPQSYALIEAISWQSPKIQRDFFEHGIHPIIYEGLDRHHKGLRLKLEELSVLATKAQEPSKFSWRGPDQIDMGIKP